MNQSYDSYIENLYVDSVKELLATEIAIHLFSANYPSYLPMIIDSETLDENENIIIEWMGRDDPEFWEWMPADTDAQADYVENFTMSEVFLEISDRIKEELFPEGETINLDADIPITDQDLEVSL